MTFLFQKFCSRFRELSIILMVLFPLPYLQANMESKTATLLSLEECVSIALSNNPAFISSAYAVEESRLKTTEARSGFYPSVNLSAGADVLKSGKNEWGGKEGAYSRYNTGISARYFLYQGGRKTAAYEAAESAFRAVSYQHEGGLQELILNISQAYYRFLQSQHMEKAAGQALERAEYHLEFAKARFEAGVVSRSDILKAEVEKSNAELSLIRARNTRLFARGSLNVLMGREAHSHLEVQDNLENFELKGSLDYDVLLEQALLMRPEIKKTEAQLAAHESDIRIARSSLYPWVSADAGFNLSGLNSSGMESGWFAGLSLNFPIFTGFANQARVFQEKAALRAMEKQMESLKQEISREVWNAYLDLKESEELIDNSEIFLANARENLAIAEEEYREGVGSMMEVIDAETALVAAEENRIEALAGFKIALAVVDRVAGTLGYDAARGDK